MTADPTDRITKILRDNIHQTDLDEFHPAMLPHLAALIAAAAEEHYRPRIETPEQLDALPFHTVIQRDAPRSVPLWKTNHLWCFGDRLLTDSREVEGHLPAVVLWSPGAGEWAQA